MSETALDSGNVLMRIVADKRLEVLERSAQTPLESLRRDCESVPPARGFLSAIRRTISRGSPAVIAEIKRASPSRGLIREDFDPAAIATSYAAAGAACLSVLTDEKYFLGHSDFLAEARGACELPVLRKDFTIDEYQVWEARAMGADCILLIAAVLEDDALASLYACAREIGLDVLVEVHDHNELQRAIALGADLVGINNRDLRDFTTTIDTTIGLLPAVAPGSVLVTESGIRARTDVDRLRAAGVSAFLVGEAFMSAENPGDELRQLFFPYAGDSGQTRSGED